MGVVQKNKITAEAKVFRVRGSVYKMNLVADMIRAKTVDEAFVYLSFCRKGAAPIFLNCLKSAVANAEHNFGMDISRLKVKLVLVGKDIVLKRFMARGRGRSSGICKMYSRLTIVVSEIDS